MRCVPEEMPAPARDGGGGDDGLPDLSQRYVLSKTGPEELGELGIGIGLYFETLLWGAKVLCSMTFLGFFTVIVYLRAGTLVGERGKWGGIGENGERGKWRLGKWTGE